MQTYVWLDKCGRYLKVNQVKRLTSDRLDITFVDDIDEASVLANLPAEAEKLKLVKVPAREERRVFLEVL